MAKKKTSSHEMQNYAATIDMYYTVIDWILHKEVYCRMLSYNKSILYNNNNTII